MIPDLPLFGAGSAITTGGALAKTAGSFALPAVVDKMLEIKERNGGTIDLEHTPEAILEATKEGVISGLTGFGVGLAGLPAKAIADKISNPLKSYAVEKAINIPAVGATLLGVEHAKGNDITAGTVGETLGTIAVMELMGSNPFTKMKMEKKAQELGVTPDRLIKNIDPDMASRIKSVEDAETLINDAKIKTESELKQEHINNVQNEIINTQIQANYKEGKAPEDVIQLTQIPKEHLPYVADVVDGVLRVKPEIIEKMKGFTDAKADPNNNPFSDNAIPFETKSPIEKYQEIKNLHADALNKYNEFKNNKDSIKKQLIDEYVNSMGERRYEKLTNIRAKMDEAINYVMNNASPVDLVKMLENPESIKSVVPLYNDLKPTYQKSLTSEIQHAIIKATNILPESIKEKALKYADFKMGKIETALKQPVDDLRSKGKAITEDIEFQKAFEIDRLQKMNDLQKQEFIKSQVKNITKDYDQNVLESKNYWNPELQKVLGTSPDYGDRTLNPKEYGSHYTNLVDWFRTPIENLTKTFEGMGYLNFKVNAKAGIDNKSRIIQTRLGEKAYRQFADPIREATYTFTKELSIYKDKIKIMKEGLNPKAREHIGAYMLGLQNDAVASLEKMKIKIPKWEELSNKQQATINEFNKIFEIMFDRVNVSRQLVGLEPIQKVDNYFTFIRKFSAIEHLGFDPLRVKSSVFDDVKLEDVKTRSLSFAFGKDRNGASTRGLELDAFNVMDKYLYSALRTTHLTPVVGRLRTALDSDKLMLTNPNGYDYLNMTLDFVSGKKISEAKEITNYLANVVHRNLTSATLAYNLHTIAVQPSSAGIAGMEIGTKYLAQGAKDFLNPVMRDFAMKESKVLLTRTYDATIDEVKKGVTGNVSKLQTKAIEIGNIPTKYTDLLAAEITWCGGYRYAKDELNLNHKGCVTYADDLVIKTQGSADRLDLSPIQHTPLGKLATTFQTFTINQFGYLKDEILGLGKEHKMVAEGISKKDAEEKFNATGYIKKPIGDNKFNVYETKRLVETPDAIKKSIKFAVVLGVMNTIYELMGINPPNPAPASAFYQGLTGQEWADTIYGMTPTKKDTQLTDAFLASLRESAMIFPIAGGAAKYGGGNAGGAFGSLVIDTFDILADRPAAKPWGFVLSKWAGVPGATQSYKILKELKKERIAEHKKDSATPESIKRQMNGKNPISEARKQLNGGRYKDTGLVQGAWEQLTE